MQKIPNKRTLEKWRREALELERIIELDSHQRQLLQRILIMTQILLDLNLIAPKR